MYLVLAVSVSLLAGIQLGATWPRLAFWRTSRASREQGQESTMPNSARTLRRLKILSWLLALMLLVTFCTGVGVIVVNSAVKRNAAAVAAFEKCEAGYQQTFITIYGQRTSANAETQKAIDQAFNTFSRVLRGKTHDAGAVERSIDHYRRVRRQQKEQQAKNPVPPLPTTVCGPAPKG
jgi:Na+/H+ antiporter NhaC